MGVQVLVHYNRAEKEAAAVVAEIREAGGKAEKVAADLGTADGPHQLAGHVRAIVGDRLDILVSGAGMAKSGTIEETTVEDFDALFAVNVRAPYFLLQQLLPVMCKGSSVVLLSALAAPALVGSLSACAATQGALGTLVAHFAAALADRGIRVNGVAPGVVPTAMVRELMPDVPALRRLAQPEDMGAVIVFLASDEARWISGDTLRVDGGAKL